MNRPPCLHPKGRLLLQAVVILLAGYWVFSPALHGDWLWNDKSFLAESSLVRDPGGLWRIWFARQGPDYFPLRTTVQWVQWRLAGEDPFGYHLTNLGLQILSAFLLWRLLYKLGVRFAALGALLLVVHPLMVERVAWIAGLKSALALPFALAALLAYLRHESRGRGAAGSLLLFIPRMLSRRPAQRSVGRDPSRAASPLRTVETRTRHGGRLAGDFALCRDRARGRGDHDEPAVEFQPRTRTRTRSPADSSV